MLVWLGRRDRSHIPLRWRVEVVRPLVTTPERGIEMTAAKKSKTVSTRATRNKLITYWVATGLVVAELVLGGIWDILRIPLVRDVVTRLGYPTYFLVLLGIWKLLGAAALLLPRLPLVKEWAYAGVFFVFSGAIVSHLATGKDVRQVGYLSVVIVLTAASWALRPATRRLSGRTAAGATSRHES